VHEKVPRPKVSERERERTRERVCV